MPIRVWTISLLLFASGISALIYQVCWLRDLRLIFGSSTVASSVVVAIFLGGIGLGGAFWGRIADRNQKPLLLYAWLELLAGASAVLALLLIFVSRKVYIALGGQAVMGPLPATLLRMALAALALGPTCFFLGGTLAAAARAVESRQDVGRRDLSLLYGVNTLGGVVGVGLATFLMLEALGTRNTALLAALFNIMTAGVAFLGSFHLYRQRGLRVTIWAGGEAERQWRIRFPAWAELKAESSVWVYAVAGILGFSFLLMEIVWYRMLAPLLGGSTYTFGTILAVALLGMGIGGLIFAARNREVQTNWRMLSFTCVLEAFCLMIPFALGDQLAIMAALLESITIVGFAGSVFAWFMICSIVVLPAAIVSGFQFPLLIGLLGRGQHKVGAHTGLVYAWNTVGAIGGALGGGMLLLPLLSAPGCWLAVAWLLLITGLAIAVQRLIREKNRPYGLAGLSVITVALLLFATGPTAVWRHSGIGAGLTTLSHLDYNQLQDWKNQMRRQLSWETDGVESSVALIDQAALAFVINGKVDGNSRSDAGTQVMAPLVGAIIHSDPKQALVIGLGTGSSGGWLAKIDSIERVDIVELEPAILEVARQCAPVNHNVLANPKVRTVIGDGREFLLTGRQQYDLIFSEPSNPYRVGISSLYTKEFYQAAARRLKPGGVFSQWLQGYSVDGQTVATIYATLATAFPNVETWQTKNGDLLLVCSSGEITYDVPALRRKISREPFRSALLSAWGGSDLEAFFSRYVAGPAMSLRLAAAQGRAGRINVDDRMLVEFGFARSLAGQGNTFSIMELRELAKSRGEQRPRVTGGPLDWALVDEAYFMMYAIENIESPIRAYNFYINSNYDAILAAWDPQAPLPPYPMQIVVLAEALAEKGDNAARPLIERLREILPTEADAILARLLWQQGDGMAAYRALEAALIRYRHDPWPQPVVMRHALDIAGRMATDPGLAEKVFSLLSEPFSVFNLNEQRLTVLLDVASKIDYKRGAKVLAEFEPHVPWRKDFLSYRFDCYQATGHPLTKKAGDDLDRYLRHVSESFSSMYLNGKDN